MIRAGVISVNGKRVTDMGVKISVSDSVKYNGEKIREEKKYMSCSTSRKIT